MEEKKLINPEFKKYSSIEILGSKSGNFNLRKWQHQIIKQNESSETKINISDIDWVISEKIHGCNFSFIISDDSQITCARRTDILKESESFHNYQTILKQLKEKLLNLYQICKKDQDEGILEQIQVYGELYGGTYPHKEVPKAANSKQVQKGVFYCPQNSFSIFDITLVFEQKEKNEENEESEEDDYSNRVKLPFKQVQELCNKAELHFIKPLKIGKFEELEKFDANSFESQVYLEYGLPKIENNIAEGVVLRPYEFSQKPIFKIKSKAFNEMVDKKEDKSKEKGVKKAQGQDEYEKNKEENEQKMEKLLGYVNENRLESVLSKLTEEEKKNKARVYNLLTKDAQEDFAKNCEEQEKWLKEANKYLLGLIKKNIFAKAIKTFDQYDSRLQN